MAARKDYTGRRVGHLTFIQFVKAGGGGVGSIWELRCDCGATRVAAARDVSAKRIRTCGKCKYHHDLLGSRHKLLRQENYHLRRAYQKAVTRAEHEGVEFRLSPQQFREIRDINCRFCDKDRAITLIRVRPGMGYTQENTVGSCTDCSVLLRGRTFQELLDILARMNLFSVLPHIEET